MDPIACLNSIADSIIMLDWEEATESLLSYRRWRVSGGFEPTMPNGMLGDTYYEILLDKTIAVARIFI